MMKDKWLQFWSLLSDANDDLNIFLENNGSSKNQKGIKKFLVAFEKMKASAEKVDDIVQSPVDPVDIKLPFSSKTFEAQWLYWKDYRQESFSAIYRSRHESKALEYLKEISENNENNAIKILDFAMANGYPRFFKLNDKNVKSNKSQENETDSDF